MTSKRYSFWWDNTAPDFCFQPQLPAYADVIIIGAGIAGLSTAYWLARLTKKHKKAFRILVLDEAPHPGFKASGRIGGSVYLGSNKMPSTVVKTVGVDTAINLYRYSGENNTLMFRLLGNGLSCDLESNGGLRVATNANEATALDESHEFMHTKLGVTSARFDHKQSQHLAVMPTTNGSLYLPFEGMLDPFAFCNNLSRLLRNAGGVSIMFGAPVYEAGTDKNGQYVVLNNGHVIHATNVVHATTKVCQWEELFKHVVYKREHVVRTKTFGEDLDDMVLPLMPLEIGSLNDSVRLSNRSLLMTGGKSGLKKDVELDVLDDSDYNKRVFDHLNADMLKHFPFTNLLEFTHVWTYIETGTDDTLPVMGAIAEHPGHYLNVAHGRNKLGLAFLGGKNIAESIIGMKPSNEEYQIFSPNRFKRGEHV